MTEKQQSLYAYAIRCSLDGTLVILHENINSKSSFNFDFPRLTPPSHYAILVSSSKERIEKHGNAVTGERLEHQLIDISSLISNQVISRKSLFDLDEDDKQKPVKPISKSELYAELIRRYCL